MKLLTSLTSPYGRKCRVLIREQSLENRIEEVITVPLEDPPELQAANPLGKVPCLLRDDAAPLFNSPLICEFIDSLDDDRWLPESGVSRWRVLRFQAIADGMMDLTVGRLIEKSRPEDKQFDLWPVRQEAGIARSLDLLEDEADKFVGAFDLGAMSIAVALGYLDFRYPESNWRDGHERLAAFYERWSQRPSFMNTEPPAS